MRNKSFSILAVALILMLLAGGLIWINRDLFHYSYDLLLERTFSPDVTGRQDYLIAGPVALKPGTYNLSPELTAEGSGSGIFLIDGNEEELFYADLEDGMKNPDLPFEINGSSKQVRIGIRYIGDDSRIIISRLIITGDHVLYRESLLRHLTISAVLILFALWLVLRLCFPNIMWKLFPVFRNPANELTLLLLIGLTAAACWPIFDPKTYFHGDDMFFHVTRIRGLADSLKAGYFPVRDQLYWLHNYGYGVGFFYPDVFLYFPAVLVLLGFNLLTAYDTFLIICSFFSIASMWYAVYRLTGNRLPAAAAAILYAFTAYRHINIYYRAAFGEIQAAVFYPLIILGLYEIFFRDKKRWPVFALGFLGLFCCHVISLILAVILTAFFILMQVRKLFKDPQIICALLKAVLTVVGIGAFFWLPMFEQSFTNPMLKINNLLAGDVGMNQTNYAFPAGNIFIRFKAWSWMWQAKSVYPGWVLLLVPCLRIMILKDRSKYLKTADFLLVFSLPVLWMCTRAFPWEWDIFLPVVTRIQFAYRFLLPVSAMVCFSGGIIFSCLIKKRNAVIPMILLACFCFFTTTFPILQESVRHRIVEKRMFVMQDNRVSGEEYLPLGLDSEFPDKNADTVLITEDVPLTITAHKRQRLGFSFSYEVPEDKAAVHFSVPLIYYTGFQASLKTEDGTVLHPAVRWDDRGLVSVSSEGIPRGSVSVYYEKTACQWIGECITILSLVMIGLLIRKKSFQND